MAAEKLKRPAKIVIASAAKQSRSSIKTTSVWIATPGFALLAITKLGISAACEDPCVVSFNQAKGCNLVKSWYSSPAPLPRNSAAERKLAAPFSVNIHAAPRGTPPRPLENLSPIHGLSRSLSYEL
jgi:hypothetical protein